METCNVFLTKSREATRAIARGFASEDGVVSVRYGLVNSAADLLPKKYIDAGGFYAAAFLERASPEVPDYRIIIC